MKLSELRLKLETLEREGYDECEVVDSEGLTFVNVIAIEDEYSNDLFTIELS